MSGGFDSEFNDLLMGELEEGERVGDGEEWSWSVGGW